MGQDMFFLKMREVTACLFVDRAIQKRGQKIMWEKVRIAGFMFLGSHVVLESVLCRWWECPLLGPPSVVELWSEERAEHRGRDMGRWVDATGT